MNAVNKPWSLELHQEFENIIIQFYLEPELCQQQPDSEARVKKCQPEEDLEMVRRTGRMKKRRRMERMMKLWRWQKTRKIMRMVIIC